MNIRIVKNGGDYTNPDNFIDLPGNIKFKKIPWKRKWSMPERATQSGGVILGDGTISPFKLMVSGVLHSVGSVNKYIGNIKRFCYYNGPVKLYIIGNTVDDVYFWQDVELERADRAGKVYNSVEEINLDFLIPNPFEYAENETIITKTGLLSGDVFNVEVTGYFEVYPEMKFTGQGSGINGNFSITNQTDKYLNIEIIDPTFGIGDVINVNNYSGTIENNGISIIQYLNTSFIRLLPGVNTLKYEGQEPIDLEIKFRELR